MNVDRFLQVFTLGFLIDMLVVDPAVTVARDFPFRRPHRIHDFRVALERHRNAEYRDRYISIREHVVQPPETGAGTVLV